MKSIHHHRLLCGVSVVFLLAGSCYAAATGTSAPAAPAPPAAGDTVTISSKVEGFNLNEQRGTPEGLFLRDKGDLVQVNLPESIADAVAKNVAIGDTIQVTAMTDSGPGGPNGPGGPGGGPDAGRGGPQPPGERPTDHPVYRARSVRDARGQTYTDASGPGGPGGTGGTVTDTVKMLNYDQRGSLNGLQLSKGDFVHLNREAASTLTVKAGDSVTVEGPSHPMPSGTGKMIDAQTINGTAVGGPGGRGAPPPPGGGPDSPGGPGAFGPGGFGRGGPGAPDNNAGVDMPP